MIMIVMMILTGDSDADVTGGVDVQLGSKNAGDNI